MHSKKITQTEDYVDDNLANGRRQSMRGTDADAHDMRAMGKVQQLNRNFRFISILGFSCTAMSTWEITLASSTFGLINGGLPGLVWAYFFVWIGYCTVFASIAELASMMPTAGGQYHWVSELSPKSTQKFLSYIVGWLSAIGWQAGYASITFIAGTLIQGLIVLNDESYVFKRWHGTLLVIAITALSIVFNSFLAKHLPLVETLVLVLHILGFVGVLITLWVMAPRNSTDAVFTDFVNSGGWVSTGLSVMVGMLTAVYGMLGADSAVHMSEEIRDASLVLPRTTMWALVINGGCGATKSHVETSIMIAVLIINTTSSCISTVATVSRQLVSSEFPSSKNLIRSLKCRMRQRLLLVFFKWSFARDGGLPYSKFIAVVRPRWGWNIPLNAVCLTFLFTTLLSLMNIGSTVAFNAICSMATNAMISTYIIAILCLVLRRLRNPAAIPPRRWSLGKFGLPINMAALLCLTWIWVFCFFPQTMLVTAKTMNWNIVIIAGIMVLAVGYYFVGGGREKYVAPVVLVKRNV
ncbi:hypothetical protein ABEF95_014048 [Exophiala dermatitidis]